MSDLPLGKRKITDIFIERKNKKINKRIGCCTQEETKRWRWGLHGNAIWAAYIINIYLASTCHPIITRCKAFVFSPAATDKRRLSLESGQSKTWKRTSNYQVPPVGLVSRDIGQSQGLGLISMEMFDLCFRNWAAHSNRLHSLANDCNMQIFVAGRSSAPTLFWCRHTHTHTQVEIIPPTGIFVRPSNFQVKRNSRQFFVFEKNKSKTKFWLPL